MKKDQIIVRLAKSDKKLFRRAAEVAGISLSEWVREAMMQSASVWQVLPMKVVLNPPEKVGKRAKS